MERWQLRFMILTCKIYQIRYQHIFRSLYSNIEHAQLDT